jgi:cell division protein FtsL
MTENEKLIAEARKKYREPDEYSWDEGDAIRIHNWAYLPVEEVCDALEAETEERKEREVEWSKLSAEVAGRLVSHGNRIEELEEENRKMREAMKTLQKEYEEEAEEYGFPFNFQLRDAHREMLRLLEVLEEGERDRD